MKGGGDGLVRGAVRRLARVRFEIEQARGPGAGVVDELVASVHARVDRTVPDGPGEDGRLAGGSLDDGQKAAAAERAVRSALPEDAKGVRDRGPDVEQVRERG